MKKIPYGRQYIDNDDINAVIEVLRSDFLTTGPKAAEFEQGLADFHNCRYAVVFSSGTAALHAAYHASGIKAGDEFITTPITFAASANAGLYCMGTPVLCDIDLDTYNIDIKKIGDKITKKTKVITPVSYGGRPVDIKKIRDLYSDVTIIHDACHALGASINGAGICDYSDMTVVSFHPVKHITSGEGGVVLTNSEQLYDRLKLFRTHGITHESEAMKKNDGPWYYEMKELGYNYRLSDIQCALGISQLKKAEWSLKKRNAAAQIYHDELKVLDYITLPPAFKGDGNLNAYHLFPVLLPNADMRLKMFNYLRENNINVQVHYIPLNYMPYYKKNYGFAEGDMPKGEYFYQREISIPMFPTLSESEQLYVIDKIKAFK